MRSEIEIHRELDRLMALPEIPLVPNPMYVAAEAIHTLTRVEKGARIALLKWVLGGQSLNGEET